MRGFVDDASDDHPEESGDDDEKVPAVWSVGVLDDCDACGDLRVMVTLEPLGRHGAGVVAHLSAANAVRLRLALATALRQIGADPG